MRWTWPPQWKKWKTRIVKIIILILFLNIFFLTISHPVHAQSVATMGGLLEACKQVIAQEEGQKDIDQKAYGLCFGYVQGVKNSYDIQRIAQGKNHRGKICFRRDSTWIDIIRAFVNWAERHTNEHKKNAWLGFVAAMKSSFPCAPGMK